MKTTTRSLTAGLALALGLILAPTAVGAVDGLKAPTPTPPPPPTAGGHKTPTTTPPPPPVGADDIVAVRPVLSVELDETTEVAGIEGRLRLSSPLTQELGVSVGMRFPSPGGMGPWEIACEQQPGGGCDHSLWIEIPAGATVADFDFDQTEYDDGPEDAELIGAEITYVSPASAVQVPVPSTQALVSDGDGLDLTIAEGNPEGIEGDAGSDGTLEVVVEADQAVPHPVTFRATTTVAGGSNGATAGIDYTPIDVIVELPADETSVTVEVPFVGDDLDESPYELLHVGIGEPSHGEVTNGSRVARILDDDQPVVGWTRPGGYQSPSRSARSAALTA